ncbi:MAG: hypothetical protein KKF12_20665 [Proteobacteria bacterium]|nr:hypothetical protein [Desulfobacula sp.]MBU3954456.1 hypothetical protein [Pseudomonadota bacterium]MBU4133240.1 hypothetical protein [Pseudomonadota bacterium]
METFVEIKPGRKPLQRIYLGTMLWFVGRAIQAAARVDNQVKKEFQSMPPNYTFSLGAFPNGPYMVVGKNDRGKATYLGGDLSKQPVDLEMTLKSMEHLFVLFTFRESTPTANSRDRMIVNGDVPQACAAVRILDIVQVYLLPKFIARLAIKRYPKWSLKRHTLDRTLILIRTLIGI